MKQISKVRKDRTKRQESNVVVVYETLCYKVELENIAFEARVRTQDRAGTCALVMLAVSVIVSSIALGGGGGALVTRRQGDTERFLTPKY
jgi:hypothetical protein